MSKTILYIATSADNFIADKNGKVDWLPDPQPDDVAEFGYAELYSSIDIIIMGSKSYEQILGFGPWAWNDKQTYVFSSRQLPLAADNISIINAPVGSFLESLKKEKPDQNIWLLGGAQLVKSCADLNLIDECIITIIPKTLGQGIELELPYNNFDLIDTKECKYGIAQKRYLKKK